MGRVIHPVLCYIFLTFILQNSISNKPLITSVSILHTSIPHRKGYTRINLFTLLFDITLLQFYKTLHHKTKIILYSVITWKKTKSVHYFYSKTPSTKF